MSTQGRLYDAIIINAKLIVACTVMSLMLPIWFLVLLCSVLCFALFHEKHAPYRETLSAPVEG